MDILTHTLTGLAVGTCIASFSQGGWRRSGTILLFSGLGGALPDIDAISLWSGFDQSIGKLFGLDQGKVIYSAKLWYSHHGFMHSLAVAFLIAFLIGCLFYFFTRYKGKRSWRQTFTTKGLILVGFISGFILHLLQDMITPSGSWGGVRLFFPSEIYIGGTGDVWWWNNYNLFMIVLCTLVINLIFLVILFRKSNLWKWTMTVFAAGVICFLIGIKQINYNFNGKKYEHCEQKSKEIQQDILGDKLYLRMVKLDNSLKIYF